MNGSVQQKSLLKASLTNLTIAKVFEIILLLMAGVLAIVLHERLRSPINIPGHHGMEFMAIILAARLSSKIKWASSISAIGIGIFILFPVLGFKDPMMGFNYMLPCFFLDIAYQALSNNKYSLVLLSFASGLAYMLIPISRIIITITTAYPYTTFLKYGYVTTVAAFFLFGFMGGLLGTGIFKLGKKVFRNN